MILKRNIILFAICALYMLINMSLASLFFDTKINKIQELETKHISVNESYITAQILSSSLDKVYTIFEKNLATISCKNSKTRSGAEITIVWKNKDLNSFNFS